MPRRASNKPSAANCNTSGKSFHGNAPRLRPNSRTTSPVCRVSSTGSSAGALIAHTGRPLTGSGAVWRRGSRLPRPILRVKFFNSKIIMIPRYTRPEMGRIWSDRNKFQQWLEVELAASEALAQLGVVPAEAARLLREHWDFDVEGIHQIGKVG